MPSVPCSPIQVKFHWKFNIFSESNSTSILRNINPHLIFFKKSFNWLKAIIITVPGESWNLFYMIKTRECLALGGIKKKVADKLSGRRALLCRLWMAAVAAQKFGTSWTTSNCWRTHVINQKGGSRKSYSNSFFFSLTNNFFVFI